MSEEQKIPTEDWQSDYRAALDLQQRHLAYKDKFPTAFEEHFRRQYPDPVVRAYRQARIATAMNWFEMHANEIESAFPSSIVGGREDMLVSTNVVLALWAMYSNMPDSDLGIDFPIDVLDPYLRG